MKRRISLLCWLVLFFDVPRLLLAEPAAAATSAFDAYAQQVESRLAQQHRSENTFLEGEANLSQVRKGGVLIDKLTPASAEFSGALLHDWRGTAFAPGAHAADFELLMRDFDAYPQHFAPQVVTARTLTQSGDRITASMRIRQHHVITVVMDATYDVTFGRFDAQRGYSVSRSTSIAEIDSPGTRAEHALSPEEEHGFLWRLNTYWSYEERDGGLYLQIEAVSLSRAIPHGLGWAIRPYVESIPRESLEFTLRSAVAALRK